MQPKLLLPLLACLVASNLALESDWNQEMRDYITDIHNDYRRNEGGCQMNKLEYDTALEEHAKYWAERCVFEHEYGDYGENLAWDSNHIPEKDLIKDAAKRWFDEKNMYSYGQYSCGNACHYTQMVWGTTEKIGCYTTRCPDLRYAYKDAWYIVCFYTPKGNWMGEKVYEKSCDTPCLEGKTLEDGLCTSGGSESGSTSTDSGGDSSSGGNGGTSTGTSECVDKDENCEVWAQYDQCDINPGWMLKNCEKACKVCVGDEAETAGGGGEEETETKTESESESGGGCGGESTCVDENESCQYWASYDQCDLNPGYMHKNCKKSCGLC